MPIKHQKVSDKADTADATKIQASDWNADHSYDIFIDQEVPVGDIDGINTRFTLAQAPTPFTSAHVYVAGLLIKPGVAYTIIGNEITFQPLVTPQAGQSLLVSYRKA